MSGTLSSGRALTGTSVLVTGGTGFIGGRLVERLAMGDLANVRVLTRRFDNASRVARFPIQIVPGSVNEPSDVHAAVRGCDIVFHCAYGNSDGAEERRLVNVEGTRNVLEAAVRFGVKRVVHVSTMLVYGVRNGDLDETAPRLHWGDAYADSKLDAENLAFQYAEKHRLGVAVVQPTVVYGPFGAIFTTDILEQLQRARRILVNGGDGLCNAVYVDDVVTALLQAAVEDAAAGQAFLVSGSEPVTWRDFFGAYERMLGRTSTISMSADEASALYAGANGKPRRFVGEMLRILREDEGVRRRIGATAEVVAVRGLANRLLPEPMRRSFRQRLTRGNAEARRATWPDEQAIEPLTPTMIRLYAARTRVVIDKAKRILRYSPAFDLARGMALTEQWAAWAGLLGRAGTG